VNPPQPSPPRALIFSAPIGEGHDLPARVLAQEIEAEAPGARAPILDGLAVLGWPVGTVLGQEAPLHSRLGSLAFEAEFQLISKVRAAQRLGNAVTYALAGRRLMRTIEAFAPDVVISTYPGLTEALGELRRRGRLKLPLVSAITDLAALRYWAHPDVDLHLVTHPESVEEVRGLAPRSRIVPVRGLNRAEFAEPRDPDEARRALGLPLEPKLVVVSGGGWAVGDLDGAVAAALELPGTMVVAICGRNERVLARLGARFSGDPRVRLLGFTDQMGDLLAAADALVHSTAGLTVLEAHVRGCPVISYGWGRGHIRINNEAFARFGLADVAPRRRDLGPALARALAGRHEPDLSVAQLPTAASVVLEHLAGGAGEHERGQGGHAESERDHGPAERSVAPVLTGHERGEQHGDGHLEGHHERADAGGGEPL
jgi:processive 1,2-diacylglycerol beta-glucosyltransferase